jgi:hypothetical protein
MILRWVIGAVLILAGLVLVCTTCQPLPKPAPIPPPAHVEAGAPDRCEGFAQSHAAELAESAAAQGLPADRVTLVFEAACEPFLDDGPDAAITSGLAAARNAKASLVTDGGALLERNPYK